MLGLRSFRRRLLAAVMLGLGLAACSASGLNGRMFRQDDVAFRVGEIPAEWRLLDNEVTEGEIAAFAFRDDRQLATIGAAGRCGRDSDDVPLRALTQHLYLGFTDRSFQSEEEFQLDGRSALRTQMTASLDGVPKHLTLVVLKKDGCVYDFWRVAEPPAGSGTETFERFVSGFRTVK
ncbi:MAG: hypothetical protein RJA70_4064 [Pseudomonadota bacterium]|jgi:hypothetical protein